jgi:hypothetical protein
MSLSDFVQLWNPDEDLAHRGRGTNMARNTDVVVARYPDPFIYNSASVKAEVKCYSCFDFCLSSRQVALKLLFLSGDIRFWHVIVGL